MYLVLNTITALGEVYLANSVHLQSDGKSLYSLVGSWEVLSVLECGAVGLMFHFIEVFIVYKFITGIQLYLGSTVS